MSAGSAIRRLRDRPIGEHERRAAFTVVAVVVIAATLLLTITVSGAPPHSASARERVRLREAPNTTDGSSVSTDAAVRAACRFLHGYLGYIYGRTRAEQVSGATSGFARSLPGRAPRVPPSMRARHPRVVALHAVKMSAGAIEVTAVINDGGLVDYPIALLLSRRGSRLLVSGVDGA